MTYQVSANTGSHLLNCDIPHCASELIAPDQDELFSDANLAGWVEDNQQHMCPNCVRGIHTGATQLKAMFGNNLEVQAVTAVKTGDPVYDAQGKRVATYKQDGEAGDTIPVELYVPTQAKVQVSEKYAQILGLPVPTQSTSPHAGMSSPVKVDATQLSPEDEDLFGAFDVDAGEGFSNATPPDHNKPSKPAKAPVSPPKAPELVRVAKPATQRGPLQKVSKQAAQPLPTKTLAAPAGTAGGVGAVVAPPRPNPEQVAAAKAANPYKQSKGGPQVDIGKLLETSNLFGSLEKKTGWDPNGK